MSLLDLNDSLPHVLQKTLEAPWLKLKFKAHDTVVN